MNKKILSIVSLLISLSIAVFWTIYIPSFILINFKIQQAVLVLIINIICILSAVIISINMVINAFKKNK